MARKFFYVCAGMFLLALSYHFGASTATAQAPSNPVAVALDGNTVVTTNGDVYATLNHSAPGSWSLVSNVFGGGPTPAVRESWGSLKSRYAPQSAPVLQSPKSK